LLRRAGRSSEKLVEVADSFSDFLSDLAKLEFENSTEVEI
jgi:hypothetical protein